jgi:HTH-type transcriptional regulator / antitoxin HigA
MNDIKPIKTEADYDSALVEIAKLMGAEEGTTAGDQLDVLVTLVEAYEARHWRIDPPDPIDVLNVRLDEGRLTRQKLELILGSRSRVSEILHRKRPLTLTMIRRLHSQLGISAESLIQPITQKKRRARRVARAA